MFPFQLIFNTLLMLQQLEMASWHCFCPSHDFGMEKNCPTKIKTCREKMGRDFSYSFFYFSEEGRHFGLLLISRPCQNYSCCYPFFDVEFYAERCNFLLDRYFNWKKFTMGKVFDKMEHVWNFLHAITHAFIMLRAIGQMSWIFSSILSAI